MMLTQSLPLLLFSTVLQHATPIAAQAPDLRNRHSDHGLDDFSYYEDSTEAYDESDTAPSHHKIESLTAYLTRRNIIKDSNAQTRPNGFKNLVPVRQPSSQDNTKPSDKPVGKPIRQRPNPRLGPNPDLPRYTGVTLFVDKAVKTMVVVGPLLFPPILRQMFTEVARTTGANVNQVLVENFFEHLLKTCSEVARLRSYDQTASMLVQTAQKAYGFMHNDESPASEGIAGVLLRFPDLSEASLSSIIQMLEEYFTDPAVGGMSFSSVHTVNAGINVPPFQPSATKAKRGAGMDPSGQADSAILRKRARLYDQICLTPVDMRSYLAKDAYTVNMKMNMAPMCSSSGGTKG